MLDRHYYVMEVMLDRRKLVDQLPSVMIIYKRYESGRYLIVFPFLLDKTVAYQAP